MRLVLSRVYNALIAKKAHALGFFLFHISTQGKTLKLALCFYMTDRHGNCKCCKI